MRLVSAKVYWIFILAILSRKDLLCRAIPPLNLDDERSVESGSLETRSTIELSASATEYSDLERSSTSWQSSLNGSINDDVFGSEIIDVQDAIPREIRDARRSYSIANLYIGGVVLTSVLFGVVASILTFLCRHVFRTHQVQTAVLSGLYAGLLVVYGVVIFSLLNGSFTVNDEVEAESSNEERRRLIRGIHPATRTHTIDQLSTEQLSELCVICLDPLSEASGGHSSIAETCPKHLFHLKCLLDFYATSDFLCPICRNAYHNSNDVA